MRKNIDVEQIVELYKNGCSPSEIAKRFNVHAQTIRNRLYDEKIPIRTISEALSGRSITWSNKISKSLQGHTTSYQARKNISKVLKGKTSPKKGKTHKTHPNLITQYGKNHWNWQNGKTDKIAKLRNSIEYKQWRRFVFERDQFTCQQCGQKGGILNAHHIIPFKTIKEQNDILHDINNGITLCVKCHKNYHNKHGK